MESNVLSIQAPSDSSIAKLSRPELLLAFIAVILFFAGTFNTSAQTYWMQKGGGTTEDEAYAVSMDGSGNTYTTGYFSGTASFGSFNLTASGVSDIFVAKTNSSGAYQWVVKGGDGGSDRGLAIATDASGNTYVTGYYYGTATFGVHTITSVGLQDVFVVKYDNSGAVQWVVSGGGSQADIGNSIAIDHNGNVIVTGQFAGTANFGSFTLNSTNNNINVFTTKLNGATGAFMWAVSGTGPHTDRGLGVACDLAGNAYVMGEFSDTITFTTPHYSPLNTAIFIVKYNTSGVEQWITTAGGGTSNIGNSIAVDNGSNVYITGNFTGTLTFYANTNVTLTQTYVNRIFIAKYDQSANLLWDVADGSSNPLTSNFIAVDGSGNAYITGSFECVLNSYADQYGQGTFNTVGYWDIFNAEYSSGSGAWQWSRQIAGHGNNYGYGIAVSPTGTIAEAGSFDQDMIITNSAPLAGYNVTPVNGCTPSYCSDANYSKYSYFNTAGGLDAFVAEPIDLTRQTYDFYQRSGNSCSRPVVPVCVGTSNVCLDTVQGCTIVGVSAIPQSCNFISPYYTYLWSTGSHNIYNTFILTGHYTVTQTSQDSCISTTGDINIIIPPPPSAPTISDNVVINTNSSNPQTIRVCQHSVVLTGGNYNGDSTWYWTTPNNTRKDSTSITVTLRSDSGAYCFYVVNKYGCINKTCVWVAIDSALPKIIPKIICVNCRNDTAFVCKGKGIDMLPYDSITNPYANTNLCIPPAAATINNWHVSPNASYNNKTYCPDDNGITPYNWDSGWYHITDTIVQSNVCGTKRYILKDSVYIRIYLVPTITLHISGDSTICSSDSEWIVGSGNTPFTWSNGSTEDSIYVGIGSYSIKATATNAYGCSATGTASINIRALVPITPSITMNPSDGTICPNDSLQLTCNGGPFQNYQWYGPIGPLAINSTVVYVKVPGNYYCVASNGPPCPVSRLSNTVTAESYSTPYLQSPPSHNFCAGDSLLLKVIAGSNAIIQWLPPLSGDSITQVIKAPGTYSVKITSCGITTTCTTIITESSSIATITASPSKTLCTLGDSIRLSALPRMANYRWSPGNDTTQNMYVKQAGTYSLSTIDTFGCTASADIIIFPPIRDSLVKTINITCWGDSTGLISIGVKGGSAPYTYAWAPPEGSGATASNLSAGSYTVSVNDANGCTKKIAVTLTQPIVHLTSEITSYTNVACFGDFTGKIIDSVYGGKPTYSYAWSPGGQTSSAITGLGIGSYSITVTDANGCKATTGVTITQPPLLSVNISEPQIICKDSTGIILANATGGTEPYSYSWSSGITSVTSTATIMLTGNLSFSVTVTDAQGCTASAQITLEYGPPFTVGITGQTTFCIRDSTTICANVTGGTNGVSYLWQPGNNTNACIVIKPAFVTTYTITVIDGCGATATAGVTISPEPSPVVNFSANIFQGCPPLCIQFYNNITILQGNVEEYVWRFGNGDSSYSQSPVYCYPVSGTYNVSLTAISNNGCSATLSKINMITVFAPANAAFTLFPQPANILAPTIQFTDISKNEVSIAYRLWSFGDATDSSSNLPNPIHTYQDTGRYCANLTIMDSQGCMDTTTRCLIIDPAFTLYIPSAFTPNSDEKNETFEPKGEYIRSFEMFIYDRWGMELYHTTDINKGWDGTVHGGSIISQEDTYIYKINVTDSEGTQHSYVGNVTLIK